MDTKELIAELRAWIKEKYPMPGHKSGALLRDAADELERLVAIVERLRAIVDAARAVRSTGFQSRRADDGGRFLVGDDEYRALVNALEK